MNAVHSANWPGVGMPETLVLYELINARRDDIDVFPVQMLIRPISASALADIGGV